MIYITNTAILPSPFVNIMNESTQAVMLFEI